MIATFEVSTGGVRPGPSPRWAKVPSPPGAPSQVDYLLRRLMLLKERTDDTEDLVRKDRMSVRGGA